TVGYAATLLALVRKQGDVTLCAMAAGPALFHPVLATGLVFMLGHAGPVTARLLRQHPKPRYVVVATATLSALLAGTAVYALSLSTALLPYLAALPVAIILPHLLPHRWLVPARLTARGVRAPRPQPRPRPDWPLG
ncbi:MAG TPA: hypothetical protein VEY69_11585, partial [Lautropia sp.]|nr:hypothetical protein [Lautropia sp.]